MQQPRKRWRFYSLFFLALLIGMLVKRSSWASYPEEAKLIASDGADRDFFGDAVAISGDTAVVGARAKDDKGDSSGSVYIFRRTGTDWVPGTPMMREPSTRSRVKRTVGSVWACSADPTGPTASTAAFPSVSKGPAHPIIAARTTAPVTISFIPFSSQTALWHPPRLKWKPGKSANASFRVPMSI